MLESRKSKKKSEGKKDEKEIIQNVTGTEIGKHGKKY